MKMDKSTLTIALAGNPNSGKTTLFNQWTGANQYVGNWPGVTVAKKEGRLRDKPGVTLQDLPGVYSLSPYSPEELITRDYLLRETPDAVLNVVDAGHFERNLYLTTQLLETGLPVVVVLNMMDIVRKRGDEIHTARLAKALDCEVTEASALHGEGSPDAALAAVEAARSRQVRRYTPVFSGNTEHALAHIEDLFSDRIPATSRRFYSIKLFERDPGTLERFAGDKQTREALENIIRDCEARMDDDAESIIAAERYTIIERLCADCLRPGQNRAAKTLSDHADRLMAGRFTALPLFAAVMFLVYFLSVTLVGGMATGFISETLFGEWVGGFLRGLMAAGDSPPWLEGLLLEGILGGVGGILGFVPQVLTLFWLLALLEDVGYMARVAFIMDSFLRRFGLSGKSFIPLMVGSGCSVPAILSARAIENERERRMTVMTVPFIPCGAKIPLVGLFAAAFFDGAWWVAPCAYFLGLFAVLLSGIILQKTRFFAGEPSPFVMELPPYHLPSPAGLWRSAWERTYAFIRRAGTVILLAGVALWLLSHYSINGGLHHTAQMDTSILAALGKRIAPLFAPVGFGRWETAVATVAGLFAKEQIVVALKVLLGAEGAGSALGSLDAFCFLLFNLLCAPCVAAMSALRRELGSAGRTLGSIAYLCVFAYSAAFILRQLGLLFGGYGFTAWTALAWIWLGVVLYLLLRPAPDSREHM